MNPQASKVKEDPFTTIKKIWGKSQELLKDVPFLKAEINGVLYTFGKFRYPKAGEGEAQKEPSHPSLYICKSDPGYVYISIPAQTGFYHLVDDEAVEAMALEDLPESVRAEVKVEPKITQKQQMIQNMMAEFGCSEEKAKAILDVKKSALKVDKVAPTTEGEAA